MSSIIRTKLYLFYKKVAKCLRFDRTTTPCLSKMKQGALLFDWLDTYAAGRSQCC